MHRTGRLTPKSLLDVRLIFAYDCLRRATPAVRRTHVPYSTALSWGASLQRGGTYGPDQTTKGSSGLSRGVRNSSWLRAEFRGNRKRIEADVAGDGAQAHQHAPEKRLYPPGLQP